MPRKPEETFAEMEQRVARRRPIPKITEVFQRLHTGPHSELLMSAFRQKRRDLDGLLKKYHK